MADEQTTTTDGDTVRVLFGPGGFVRYTRFGEGHERPEVIDLTSLAADLASAGIRIPRSTCRPSIGTGELSAELGVGGRCLWVNGGGDISEAEMLWAIAATLESESIGEVLDAIGERRRRELGVGLLAFADEALSVSGLSARQRTGFMSRARAGLDGKSLRAVLELPDNDRTLVNQALSLVSERAGEGMGVEEHRAWLMECLARSRQRTPDSPPAS